MTVHGHDPAILAAKELGALRAKTVEIRKAWRLTQTQRKQMLLKNAADVRAAQARFHLLATIEAYASPGGAARYGAAPG